MSSILFYSTRKSKIFRKKFSKKLHTQKNGPSVAPGTPTGALKGDTSKIVNIFVAVEDIPSEKKSHNANKLKVGTLWDFKHPICCKISKKLKGDPLERKKFQEKVSQCRKTERGILWGFFNIHSVAEHQKIEGGKVFIFGKNLTVPKKIVRGDPLGFSNIHSDAKQQKIEGGTLWGKIFFEKKSQCRKK